MRYVRDRLTRCAALWLVCQLMLLLCGQAALFAVGRAPVVTVDCACAHGRAGMCPMHHGRSTSRGTGATDARECHGTSDPLGAVVASLIGPSAVLPPYPSTWSPGFDRMVTIASADEVSDVSRVPDSPPPRA